MRTSSAVTVTLSLLFLVSGCSASDDDGACAAPSINSITPDSAKVGDEIAISGSNFLDKCGDTTNNGVEATSSGFDGTLELTLTQNGNNYALGGTEVDDSGTFSTRVQVPAGIPSGTATVNVNFSNSRGSKITIVE